jgi:hypothetical protein
MSVEACRAILLADSAVTAIVGTGTSARVSPLTKTQGITMPAVTLQRVTVTPQNHLRGHGGLDQVNVQVDSWAETYAGARALATACRNAIQAAGVLMTSEFDNFDPETDPGLYRITQEFQFWV